MNIIYSPTESALLDAVKALRAAGLPAPELPAHLSRDYAAEIDDLLAQISDLTLTSSQADSLIGDLRRLLTRYAPKAGEMPPPAAAETTARAGVGGRSGDDRRERLVNLLKNGTLLYMKGVPLSYDPLKDEFVAGAFRSRSVSGLGKLLT
ncbi:MAG: hypothetical protein D6823_13320, partial [Chloroflexi bacterium]